MIEMALSHVNDPDLGRSLTEQELTEINSQNAQNLQARADKLSQNSSAADQLVTQQQLDRMIELLEAQEKRSARMEAERAASNPEPKRRKGFFSRD